MSHQNSSRPSLLPATLAGIDAAAAQLTAGGLVAFPTETVYGLGACARDNEAVKRIFAVKGRPAHNPLIVHVDSLERVRHDILWNETAERLAEAFWPGPMTLILPRSDDCSLSPLVSAGGDTVGIRMPGHPVAAQMLERCALPIAAPSANRSGRLSPTQAQHVAEGLADADLMILDGGACTVGIESTVIDVSDSKAGLARILRPGSLTAEQIANVVNLIDTTDTAPQIIDKSLKSPGLLSSHYAPGLPLRLNVSEPKEGEAYLAFGPCALVHPGLNLSEGGQLEEAAANLFSYLRQLDDAQRFSGIAVMPIVETGIGLAINDRLRRAAAPRP